MVGDTEADILAGQSMGYRQRRSLAEFAAPVFAAASAHRTLRLLTDSGSRRRESGHSSGRLSDKTWRALILSG